MLVALGAPLGALVVDLVGRKPTLLLSQSCALANLFGPVPLSMRPLASRV
jgi:hypothetical protein